MLLHLDSSANRSDESVTRRLTRLFADRWQAVHGSAGYRYRDLAVDPVPPIDTAYCQLGQRSERQGVVPLTLVGTLIESTAEANAWALTKPLIDEVVSSRTILIGAPMYSFSLPAALKAWIDRITFPGAFRDGVLSDTEVVVISSRGGAYGPGARREGWDYEFPYLRAYFTNYGVPGDNLRFISAELALADLIPRFADQRPSAARSLAAACEEVISSVAAAEHAGAKR
ncbi:NAD(P)H-dependent oxidoreductase [Kribbella sp. NBC_01510]|uniref:FMN-dependent NADH-azoreductase n=1 Tax=Kribbella sp. NBC_01510 TaxID=2903581 RepID=UPI00386692ED